MTLDVGQVIVFEEAFPTPLDGPPTAGFPRISLTAHDAAKQPVTLEPLTRTNPGTMKSPPEATTQHALRSGQSEAEVEATQDKAQALSAAPTSSASAG